jgi:FkbM family methyltransferase
MKIRLHAAIRNAMTEHQPVNDGAVRNFVRPRRRRNFFQRLGNSVTKRLRRLADRLFFTDGLRTKLDELAAQVSETNVRLEALTRFVQTRLDDIGLKVQLLDDIGLKVRGPLAIDEATSAIRIAEGYVSVPRTDTALLLMLSDAPVGGLEPGTRKVLLRVLAPGMTAIDVGANVGLLTLPMARKVGSRGRVYAFEPTPTTFQHLVQTIAFNEIGDIVMAQQLAIGARAERRKLFLHKVSGHNTFYEPDNAAGEAVEVEVSSLDVVIPRDAPVNLVKIDVEGAELDVLSGMARIVRDNLDIIVVAEFGLSHLRRTNVSPEQWFDAFGKFGLNSYAIDELTGKCRPINYRDVMNTISVNIAFARSSEAYRLL